MGPGCGIEVAAANGTTGSVFSPAQRGSRELLAKSDGVIAGLPVVAAVIREVDPGIELESLVAEGAWVEAGRLLKHPFVLVLWLVTFIDAFVHNCYFNWTGTFLGALIYGQVLSFGILFFPRFSIFAVFALMAAVLIVRPWGLLGRQIR